jgi:hypothetical protein
VNEYADDAPDDEVIEGRGETATGAGTPAAESEAATESEAETGDDPREAVSAGAGVGRQEVPAAPATGESAVDDALAQLSQIGESPTADHVEIYDDVHRRLTDALADIDED